MTDPWPVHADPRVWCEPDETGEALDPDTQTVGWNLSFGCHITFGMEDGFLRAQVSTSDTDQRNGITQRMVTAGQLRDYAFKLAELANAWESRQRAAAVGCDRTRMCTAMQHDRLCLGVYRTEDEVRHAVVVPVSVLEKRRSVELSTRAHAAGVAVTFGGGSDAA